ncbi:TonB-dependent receptor [Hyphomonas oceanitis SCH89]|uniref:TonB-dependent receptor n=1 Tax=Hyphomonas oceanitis SCH89 TaxID=1280953 RepID=A0A059G8W5_9PROT|nr:TonB-dependent receptor [Hyphomonas oceanitis SCH89]
MHPHPAPSHPPFPPSAHRLLPPASRLPSAANAQVTEVDADARLDTVLVVGQRAMMESAIARQRASDTIQSVVTRDALGQFPDQNVAESTRRLTGINILNDQGEGRFISVRGLDPSLNAASLNGVRLPSPESDTRAVALDVVASELIESIEVKKTLIPEMDADTIGASIEINTTKAFDREDLYISTVLEGSYNDLNGETSPKGSIDFSIPVSDTFGIAGGLSYYDRKTSTDNMEMDGWDEDDGQVYADTVEYRDYDVERERLGASLSFDWKATDATTLFARGIYSQFDDTEQRGRLTFEMDEAPTSGTGTTAFFDDADGEITVQRDLKDRFESQKIQSYQIGGDTQLDKWSFDYLIAYSEAEEHETNTVDPTRFERKFEGDGLGVTFDYANIETTKYTITSGQDLFLDPSEYEFDKIESIDGMSTDKEWSGKFDAARRFALASGDFELKAGVKARLREKDYNLTDLVYDGFDGADDYTLADVAGGQSYGLADLGPLPDLGQVRAFFAANRDLFELNAFDTEYETAAAFYDVKEDIYAAYLQGRYETGDLTVIGGVRVEQTKDDLNGNTLETYEEGATLNGEVLDEDTNVITPFSTSKDYTDWLPSVSVKYQVNDEIILRGGVFASIVRPGIGKLAPRFLIEQNDDNEREGEFGNPDLDPYHAWNADISAEYYFAPGGVIQIGAFYKDIEDFIVDQNLDVPGVYRGIAYDEATIAINGDKAKVKGVEFNYQQALDFLPGLLDGTLVGFNYTYTDAEGDVPDGDGGQRSINLPAAAKNTWNAMLGYEKEGLSLRLTAAYRDEYLDELGGDPESDRYIKDHLQIDASAKYRFNDHVQGFVEWVNLNDEPYLAFQKGPGTDRLLQYETYSWTAKAGVRLTY